MEDWQGCLSPLCQTALQQARNHVGQRGGSVITVEDFLLALIDSEPGLTGFLRGRGVDMDELVRTIQCEQPIVTEVGGEGLLSSQLLYWFSSTRDISNAPWLDWPQLLGTLTRGAERLEGKAYVAVLEVVGDWPLVGEEHDIPRKMESEGESPVVISDIGWLGLAEDIAVALAANPQALVWLRGPRGSGKSSWLNALLPLLEPGFVQLDLRCEAEIMSSDTPVMPVGNRDGRHSPVLILDNVSPAELAHFMASDAAIAGPLLRSYPGPILLLGPDSPASQGKLAEVEQTLGRSLEVFDMPPASTAQKLAIITVHQPAIEKHWGIELTERVSRFAASSRSREVGSPGGMLQWIERAAARLHFFAERGPLESTAISGQVDTLRRQSLVALARQQPVDELEASLAALAIDQAAAEVAWHERKASGTLRTLLAEDLRHELERWLAARPGPVHYVVHCDNGVGEATGAGPRNIHS